MRLRLTPLLSLRWHAPLHAPVEALVLCRRCLDNILGHAVWRRALLRTTAHMPDLPMWRHKLQRHPVRLAGEGRCHQSIATTARWSTFFLRRHSLHLEGRPLAVQACKRAVIAVGTREATCFMLGAFKQQHIQTRAAGCPQPHTCAGRLVKLCHVGLVTACAQPL